MKLIIPFQLFHSSMKLHLYFHYPYVSLRSVSIIIQSENFPFISKSRRLNLSPIEFWNY
jgi:hypothetical protein